MADLTCDVAVIDAGTAGLAAKRAAWKVGAKTVVIDERFARATCANVGCMPCEIANGPVDSTGRWATWKSGRSAPY